MSRNPEYQFLETDTNAIVADLVAGYEHLTGITVQPGSAEMLFIRWVANIVIHERALSNYAANQNIPSRADGENLDALGELFAGSTRPAAQAAVSTMRFHISQKQGFAVLIPSGTRVTDISKTLVWETLQDVYVPIGETSVDVAIRCQTVGTSGNGYAVGQINTLIDVFAYFLSCENITASDDGADQASDAEYYQLLRDSQDTYGTAGATGAYVYFAKQVSINIADAVANSPTPGVVNIFVMMTDGTMAGEEIKNAVYAACNPDKVRAFTDFVEVKDPELVPYDIELTYYIPGNATKSAADIEADVQTAVARYVEWQCGKFGRDINPSHLEGLLMQTGIKRKELSSPVFTVIHDGKDGLSAPQIATLGNISVVNGGYEDE